MIRILNQGSPILAPKKLENVKYNSDALHSWVGRPHTLLFYIPKLQTTPRPSPQKWWILWFQQADLYLQALRYILTLMNTCIKVLTGKHVRSLSSSSVCKHVSGSVYRCSTSWEKFRNFRLLCAPRSQTDAAGFSSPYWENTTLEDCSARFRHFLWTHFLKHQLALLCKALGQEGSSSRSFQNLEK